jgi:septal ring factor EnvC (AmiA/AmiB activator)
MNNETLDFLAEQRKKRQESSQAITQEKFVEQLESDISALEDKRDALQREIDNKKARLGMLKKTVMAQEDRLRVQAEAQNHRMMKAEDGHLLMMAEKALESCGGAASATQFSMALKRLFNFDIPASGISAKFAAKMEDDARFQVVRRDTRNFTYKLR